MLSSVLRSETAVLVSIRIMDAFVAMRKAIASVAPILERIETVEKRQITDQAHNEERFDAIFRAMDGGEFPQQKVFFTTVQYSDPVAVFPEGNNRYMYSHEAILFTGIANSDQLRHHVSARYPRNFHIEFDDPHVFTDKDIKQIEKFADKHQQAILLTTEKDSQRLRRNPAVHERLKERLFYIPIEIGLVEDENPEGLFDVK